MSLLVFIWSSLKHSARHIQMKSTFLFWMETVFQEISISRHVSSLGLSDEMSISDGCSICHSVQNWAFNVGQVACENIYRHSLGSLLYSMANYHLYIFKVFISTILIT